ncbi:MAG TPA: hypothetical protein VL360_01785 [Gammaproteobacteria bacterium]|jgi:hypothetical protein|nr:hypothetical protein [Gammaproteobacteria bacterium]
MKRIYFFVIAMMSFVSAWAGTDISTLLDKVSFQLKADKWVTTKSADVYVSVNAAVADTGIEKVQNQVMNQLLQISSQGEWHIVSFVRQQDKSGLETIQITAEARLPQTELNGMRDKAKSISRPGTTFTIDNVAFTPSDDEIAQANVFLRGSIYQQAKAEIDAINKVYPDQKFYLYNIEFNVPPVVMPMTMATARTLVVPSPSAAAPLNVGNKMELVANITIASMPDMMKKTPLMN